MTTPTPQERAELIVNGLLHRPDDAKGNLQFVEQAIADATAAAEAEAKAALAHIRKLEANDRENRAAFERVQARVKELEAELERHKLADADHMTVYNTILDMQTEIERLRGERREWQPIESAPINESVLVYLPNWDHYGPGIYRAMLVDMGTGRRWMTTAWASGRDLNADVQPTHWMSLPPRPEIDRLADAGG